MRSQLPTLTTNAFRTHTANKKFKQDISPEGSIVGAFGVFLHLVLMFSEIVGVVCDEITSVKVGRDDEGMAHDPADHYAGLRLQLDTTEKIQLAKYNLNEYFQEFVRK